MFLLLIVADRPAAAVELVRTQEVGKQQNLCHLSKMKEGRI
jgi:hypothetical protein